LGSIPGLSIGSILFSLFKSEANDKGIYFVHIHFVMYSSSKWQHKEKIAGKKKKRKKMYSYVNHVE